MRTNQHDAWFLQYARIVREALCELELPYILQSVGQGSFRERLLIEMSGSKEVSLCNILDSALCLIAIMCGNSCPCYLTYAICLYRETTRGTKNTYPSR